MGNPKAISNLYNLSGFYWIVNVYKIEIFSLLMNRLYQRIRKIPTGYIEWAGEHIVESGAPFRAPLIYVPLFFGIIYLIGSLRWFGACLTLIAVAHLAILANRKRRFISRDSDRIS
jgi:hypothetical protein